MDGWISLHRKIMDHPDYFRETFTRMGAWVDLLLLAAHKETTTRIRGRKIIVTRGSLILTQQQLAERWKWSRGKVKRFLDELAEEGQITLKKTVQQTIQGIVQQSVHEAVPTMEHSTVQQTDMGISVITICNYDSYQGGAETDGQQTVQQVIPEIEQQVEHKTVHKTDPETGIYNKYNNINNLNNIINPPISPFEKGETDLTKKESKNFSLPTNPPPSEKGQKSCAKKGNELDFVSDEFRPLVERWLRYKADKRQAYRSAESIRAMYGKLLRYSGGEVTQATEIIEDAMAKNYNGFFELKSYGNERKSIGDTAKTIVPNSVAERESTI